MLILLTRCALVIFVSEEFLKYFLVSGIPNAASRRANNLAISNLPQTSSWSP
jgi:hypothetical protein